MATLLELKTIYDDAVSPVPEGVTPTPEQTAAKELKNKIEAAMWKKAHSLFKQPPSDPQGRNEATGWAQFVLANSGTATSTMLRTFLAAEAAVEPSKILSSSDTAIETALNAVIGQMAKGRHPGR